MVTCKQLKAMGRVSVALSIFSLTIRIALNSLWQTLLKLIWHVNGVGRKLEEIRTGRETELRAQVQSIWFTYHQVGGPIYALGPISFFTTHHEFVKSTVILKKNVHLYSIGDEWVKFLEFDPALDLFDVRKHPFLHVAVIQNARNIIIVPRKDFDKIVSDIGEEEREVVWLFHTARCGSTLWGQIFNSLPNWTVISEQQALIYTIIEEREESDIQTFAKTKAFEDIVVAWVKSYIRLAPKGDSIFWKALLVDNRIIPVIRRRFPRHKILFAYRDFLGAAKSYYKAIGSIDLTKFLIPYVLNTAIDSIPTKGNARGVWIWYTNGFHPETCHKAIQKARPNPGVMEWYALLWAAIITMMKEYHLDGVPFRSLKYEDLMSDPDGVIRQVFEYLGISKDLVETGIDAMKFDSQAGSELAKEKTQSKASWVRDDKSTKGCNAILDHFNLPGLDEPYIMPNNIMK